MTVQFKEIEVGKRFRSFILDTLYIFVKKDENEAKVLEQGREGTTCLFKPGDLVYPMSRVALIDIIATKMLGMQEAQARSVATKNGIECRVSKRDGDPVSYLTFNMPLIRINLEVEGGIVKNTFLG